MESPSRPFRDPRPVDTELLRAAVECAVEAVAQIAEPWPAIDAAVEALHARVDGIIPSVFVLEHGRLWLIAQRGYAVVPDGMKIQSGVMGRTVRMGRAQYVPDIRLDPDYLSAHPGVGSELALPLGARRIAGVLNIESERVLPKECARLVRPLASALSPRVEALPTRRTLDLPALARLFVHLGSIRDVEEIAALAAASLGRILPLKTAQVVLWSDPGPHTELGSWFSEAHGADALSESEFEYVRGLADPSVVCQLLDTGRRQGEGRAAGPFVWLPLRANGHDLGALIGIVSSAVLVDPAQLDTAAVLAAHVAASLDAALALRRERESAVTDPLTGVLNRRGLEEQAERELASAQERRAPVSFLVIDCDDFKDINDRAGHEFGDALLREVADVLKRSLPEGAAVGRLGGDEFVVMLPEADADVALALGGRIRSVLAEGLTEAGFPLRISAGISTYPFDGAGSTALLRAADQALYAAKDAGKDRVASFRDLVRPGPDEASAGAQTDREPRRGSRAGAAALADALTAISAIVAEQTAEGVCNRLCKSLVFVVGATGCSASRVVGDYLVDATEHALREVSLGDEAAYRISDFPLSAEVLRSGQPRAISFLDENVDAAEAFILRELGMNALLMLPLNVNGQPWGLVELYEMRMRRFTDDDIAIAQFLAAQAERRLAAVKSTEAPRARPPVYELPSEGEAPRDPRVR